MLEILLYRVILADRKMRVWPQQCVSPCWDENRLNNYSSEGLIEREAGKGEAVETGVSLFTLYTCALTQAPV